MRKLIATLFAAICLITAFGQVDSLKNASLIGQASRNQKVGQGFQIGFVGSSNDTMQVNTKFQLVTGSPALNKLLVSDANGFATWENKISVSSVKTDTIFTTGGTTTGQVLILVNDTTGVFANAPFVDTIYRLTGKDSIFYVIDGRTYAILDSAGAGGGGGTLNNVTNGLTVSGDTIILGGDLNRVTNLVKLSGQYQTGAQLNTTLLGAVPASFFGVSDTVNNTYTGLSAGDFSAVNMFPRTTVLGHLDLANNRNAIGIFSADTSGQPQLSLQTNFGSGAAQQGEFEMTSNGQKFRMRNSGSRYYGVGMDTLDGFKIYNYTTSWKWPATQGTSGQVLSTDGSGTLSWATASGGGGLSVWDTSGNNIYNNNSGNVGIGTTAPAYKFNAVAGGSYILLDSFQTALFAAQSDILDGAYIGADSNTIQLSVPNTTSTNYLIFENSGLKFQNYDTTATTGYATFINQFSTAQDAIRIYGTSNIGKGTTVIGETSGGLENALTLFGQSASTVAAGTYIAGKATGGSNKDIEIFPTNGDLVLTNIQNGLGKVLTDVDGNGRALWQSSDALFAIDSIETTGDTVELAINTYTAIIASGAITDLVLRFPSSPSDGDVVVAKFDYAVTTLTSDGQGKTIYGFPSSTALGQHREWRYNSTTGAWY